MPRPTSRDQLLDVAAVEFDRLWRHVAEISPDRRTVAGACGEWSVKDLLAHLDAWHELFLGWEQDGSAGEKPQIPAPGYSFGETPALNASIFERCRDDDWLEVEARLRDSRQRVMAVISTYDDDNLFTKKRYAWTGSTSIGSYAVSATSSHYAWASKHIRRFASAG